MDQYDLAEWLEKHEGQYSSGNTLLQKMIDEHMVIRFVQRQESFSNNNQTIQAGGMGLAQECFNNCIALASTIPGGNYMTIATCLLCAFEFEMEEYEEE